MKAQPHKKALSHLAKAENFQERLSAHLKEVRIILEKAHKEEKYTPKIKMKKRRLK